MTICLYGLRGGPFSRPCPSVERCSGHDKASNQAICMASLYRGTEGRRRGTTMEAGRVRRVWAPLTDMRHGLCRWAGCGLATDTFVLNGKTVLTESLYCRDHSCLMFGDDDVLCRFPNSPFSSFCDDRESVSCSPLLVLFPFARPVPRLTCHGQTSDASRGWERERDASNSFASAGLACTGSAPSFVRQPLILTRHSTRLALLREAVSGADELKWEREKTRPLD